MPGSNVLIRIKGDAKGYLSEIGKVEKRTDGLGRKMRSAGKAVTTKFALPLIAAGAALVGAAVKTGKLADRILDLNAITGVSTDKIQEMQGVAREAGVSLEFYTKAITAVNKGQDQLTTGVGPMVDAFDTLGIAIETANGEMRSSEELTDEAMIALRNLESPTLRAALAQDIFSRSFEDLLPVLALTTEQIAQARQEAIDTGAVMSGDALNDANEFRQGMEKLQASVGGLVASIGSDLAPILTSVSAFLTDKVIPAIKGFVQWVKNIDPAVRNAALAIGGLVAALALVFANPILIGLAAVGVAVALIGTNAAANISEVERLKLELAGLGDVQPTTIADILGKIPGKDQARLAQIGISIEDISRALAEGTIQAGRYGFVISAANDLMDGPLSPRVRGELSRALTHLGNQYDDAVIAAAASANETRKTAEAEREAARAAKDIQAGLAATTAATGEQTVGLGFLARAENEASNQAATLKREQAELRAELIAVRDAQRAATAAFLEANDPAIALFRSGRAYKKALEDLDAAQGDTKISASELEEIQLRVIQTFEDLVLAKGAFEDSAQAEEAMRRIALAAGLPLEVVDELIAAIQEYNRLEVDDKVFNARFSDDGTGRAFANAVRSRAPVGDDGGTFRAPAGQSHGFAVLADGETVGGAPGGGQSVVINIERLVLETTMNADDPTAARRAIEDARDELAALATERG